MPPILEENSNSTIPFYYFVNLKKTTPNLKKKCPHSNFFENLHSVNYAPNS